MRKMMTAVVLTLLGGWIGRGQKAERFVVTVPVDTYKTTCGDGVAKPSREQVAFPVYAPNRIMAEQNALRATVWTEAEWTDCETKKICQHVEWPAYESEVAKRFHAKFDAEAHALISEYERRGIDTRAIKAVCYKKNITMDEIARCGELMVELSKKLPNDAK